jgi:uracil-DNA glycosylase family 4
MEALQGLLQTPKPTQATLPDPLWFGTSGPRDAKIVIIGEAWGYDEALAKTPYVGSSGSILTGMLKEAGIDISQVLLTNVMAARPPDNEFWRYFNGEIETRGLYPNSNVVSEVSRLHSQLVAHPRTLIIAAGNYSLWAVSNATGSSPVPNSGGIRAPTGIMNWRGSMIFTKESVCGAKIPLLPILHPAAIQRQWDLRYITVHDLRARVPMALANNWLNPNPPVFLAPPTFSQCISRLDHWLRLLEAGPLRLAADAETYKGWMSCFGIADGPNFAMSIPFVKKVQTPTHTLESWWTPEEEAQIVFRLRKILLHKNLLLEGQNFLYDAQYVKNEWGVVPYADFDTMYAWHVCFPGTPKALDYMSSLFCRYHRYWKEDHKEWDLEHGDVNTLLRYNAEDCCRTFESATSIRQLVAQFGLTEQWEWMKKKRDLALQMMLRGINIDKKLRDKLGFELMETHAELGRQLLHVVPQALAGEPGKSAKTKEPVMW